VVESARAPVTAPPGPAAVAQAASVGGVR